MACLFRCFLIYMPILIGAEIMNIILILHGYLQGIFCAQEVGGPDPGGGGGPHRPAGM